MLRPEMSPALRAVIMPPPGFQYGPVMQAFAANNAAQDLHAQQQTARIHALEASVRHQQQKIDALESQLKGALANNAQLQAALVPAETIDADVVLRVTVDGVDYICGFEILEKAGYQFGTLDAGLECTSIWAIGAVDIGQYAPDYLTNACERAAEKQRSEY